VVSPRSFGECKGQSHEQMFFLIEELIGNLDLQKQTSWVNLIRRARFLVRPRLHKIRTIARTIERHFALLAAALRADAPVNSGTEAFLLANFTNGTTQSTALLFSLWHFPQLRPARSGARKE
jgi:hypothetical protein